MEIGFETIGNATLICHDRGPVLVTDPWIAGSAYFGSWIRSHEIPEEQMESINNCRYVWVSHSHPDHLCIESLRRLEGKKILLPDHVGGRVLHDLKEEGFNVQVLPDRKWMKLTDKIRIMCIADYVQDALLLLDIGGYLIINKNDAGDLGWGGYVRKISNDYETTFLLSLSGFGDADMINFFDEHGKAIPPIAAKKYPPGKDIAYMAHSLGATHFVPFASLHQYQRADSVWVNQYVTGLSDYERGFESQTCQLLPAFIKYDLSNQSVTCINPSELPVVIHDPKEFGDDWDDLLEHGDVLAIKNYFQRVKSLDSWLGFINFRVGGKDNIIELNTRKFNTGITFEAPRGSLMTAVNFEIFDDMLIGNFMKTTLHGKWPKSKLYPDFEPYVCRYGDNARARTEEELVEYFSEYRRRAPVEYVKHFVKQKAWDTVTSYLKKDTESYQKLKKIYMQISSR